MIRRLQNYFVMTKPRAMAAVLLTAAAGYGIAVRGGVDGWLLLNLLIGTALSGGGSIVLNQFLERGHDRRMERTRQRPLPSGQISPAAALIYGVALSVVGCGWLAMTVNGLCALLAALCVVSYVLVYTPLKRVTTLNSAIGAVPGAIPPMMGWVAETGSIGVEAWLLFLILFVWQFPHFLAIGWLYREDYSRAGYAMISARDPRGHITARQMILNSACLMVVSLMPVSLSLAGTNYAVGALVLGGGLVGLSFLFLRRPTLDSARWMLRGSVVHIALLMLLLMMDKTA